MISNLIPNIFSASGLFIAILCIVMIFIILIKGKNKIQYLWLIFSLFVGIWGFGIWQIGRMTEAIDALFWWKVAHIGVIFTPIIFLHFVWSFLGQEKEKKIFILAAYLLGVIFLYFNLFTNYFILEMRWVFNEFFYDSPPTLLYIIFVSFFAILVIYSHIILFFNYKNTFGTQKIRIKYILCGTAISFAGGSLCYLPVFGIDFYPYFNFFAPLYILIVGYAILKYRFLNIKLTISNTTKILIAFILSALIGSFTNYFIKSYFHNEHLILIISFAVLLIAYLILSRFFNAHYFHKIFGITNTEYFQRVLEEFKDNIVIYKNIAELEATLKKEFCEKLKITNLKIILLAGEEKPEEKYLKLIKHCEEHSDILVTKELESLYAQKNEKIPYLKELQKLGEICLPLFEHSTKELVGFLILGEKQFYDAYSSEEIKAIQSLNQHLSFSLMSILYNLELQKQVIQLKGVVDSTVDVTQHELRTPTNVVSYALEALKDNNVPPEIKNEMIQGAYSASQKLTKIVEKIFNVQALEKGLTLNLAELNIYPFLQDLRETFRFPLIRKNIRIMIELEIPKNTFIQADREKLWQVFTNLIDNAKKFTPEGGKIILYAEKQGAEIILKVIDNGEGLPQDKQNLIFERFGTTHHNKGIALGLYICKKIIELHNGKIWYEDTKGGGASFCISLKSQS